MALPNVKSVCFFAKKDTEYKTGAGVTVPVDLGEIMDFQTCKNTYGFSPDGVNTYMGFSSKFIANWQADKKQPLLGTSGNPFSLSAQMDRVLTALNTGPKSEMTFVFALQPEEVSDPFNFMRDPDSIAALTQLAHELDEKSKLATHGKRLRVVIRFGSEMNTRENKKWGLGNPKANADDFVKAYKEVRKTFRQVSPFFLMAFSPAIRVDLDPTDLKGFYPGVANLDFLSGTWYYGGTATIDDAFDRLNRYYGIYKTKVLQSGSRFALDEWGGGRPNIQFTKPLTKVGTNEKLQSNGNDIGWENGKDHDAILKEMARKLASLSTKNISLDYATLFLQKKWNPRSVLSQLFD